MKEIIKNIIFKILVLPFYVFRIFKIKNNRIIFSSFDGHDYGENPKYICEELIKKIEQYDIYWSINNNYNNLPKNVKPVKIYSLKWFYIMSTSKVWINDSRFPLFVKKRKEQYYIQTWHSSLRLKKIEKDVEKSLGEAYIKKAKHDSKMIDIITCGSGFSENTYKKSFWYDGKVTMTGTPKFDIYFNKNEKNKIKEKIYKKYKIKNNKKVILYAPTFRSNIDNFSGNIDFSKLESNEKLMNDYIFLVRLHPESKNIKFNNKNVINVTEYPNFQDLLISSDMLITDYSGCCFDTLVANVPCILYVPDYEEYIKKERNLYFEYRELPFLITKDLNELVNNILNINIKNYELKIEKFKEKVSLFEDGKASSRIVKIINEVMKNEKI